MKAKRLLPVALAAVVALSIVPVVLADEEATITITMSGPAVAIDIEVAPTEWEIRPVELNSSYTRDFTLSNTGSVEVDTTIVGTDAEGDGYRWRLSMSPGHNSYEIEFDIEGPVGPGNVSKTPTDFVTGLEEDDSKRFALTVKTPSSGDSPGGGETLQATVTIHAVQGQ